MTGGEESTGSPHTTARRELIEAARRSDVALAFEGGRAARVCISRRGSSSWILTTTARQAHSAGVFSSGGFGAICETARILDAFRQQMSGHPTLPFNPGFIAGGVDVAIDSSGPMTASGKTNITAPKAFVHGDLRLFRESQ